MPNKVKAKNVRTIKLGEGGPDHSINSFYGALIMLSLPFIVACVMIVIENMFLNPTEKPVHPTSDGVLDSETADPQRRPSHPTPPVCKGTHR